MSDLSITRHLVAAQPKESREALLRYGLQGIAAIRKPEPLTLEVWAQRHFYLSAESSNREEQWRAWPYQIGILHCMGNLGIYTLSFKKSARLGYTKCMLARVAYNAQHARRNQCVWQPTDDDSDDFCKTDVEPMLRDVRIMRTVMPELLVHSKKQTLSQKVFLGSSLKMRGAKSARNFRRLTLDEALIDEIDGCDPQIDKSGTPDGLAAKRVQGATYPKNIIGSTPRVLGVSHIDRIHKSADVRMEYQITCPHCDVAHPLLWGGEDKAFGMKWDMEDPEGTAHHVCPHCHTSITQDVYAKLAPLGRWVSDCGNFHLVHHYDARGEPHGQWQDAHGNDVEPPRTVSMHCWTAYTHSPGVTWGLIVSEFLSATKALKAGNRGPMVQFVNETLGECDQPTGESADGNALQSRAQREGLPLRIVPAGALRLYAGVDIQNDRFEVVVWAVGLQGEMWAIDYVVVDFHPALMAEWDKLLEALLREYEHQEGGKLGICKAAIDTGYGEYTHQAYAFVAANAKPRDGMVLYAIKGSSKLGAPIKAGAANLQNINLHGRVTKNGVRVWPVGGDTAKNLFYGRLRVKEPGPGYVHFAADLPPQFFKQYANEKRITQKRRGRSVSTWVHIGGANEVVDCTQYAIFCAELDKLDDFPQWKIEEIQRHCAATQMPKPAIKPKTIAPERAKFIPPRSAGSGFASSDWLARGFT